MIFRILDPQGLTHTIERVGNEWHGYENIAHGWEPSARGDVIRSVLEALAYAGCLRPIFLPHGFTDKSQ